MDDELQTILTTLSQGNAPDSNNKTFTHVTSYGPRAKWTIRPDKLTEFWVNYCGLISRKPEAAVCLAERIGDSSPVIAEINFSFQDLGSDEPYGDDFLHLLVYCYQTAIDELFRVQDKENCVTYICCCLESDTVHDDNNMYSTAIKLQFPYCRIDISQQNKILRPRVIKLLRDTNAIARLAKTPAGDWEKYISSTTFNDALVMYGSNNKLNSSKLELVKIFSLIDRGSLNINNDDQEYENEGDVSEIKQVELSTAFIPVNHVHFQQGLIKDFFDNEPLEHWLPLFLSINYWPNITLPKTSNDIYQVNDPTPTLRIGASASLLDEGQLEMAEKLLVFVAINRFTDDHFWLNIGRALHSAAVGEERGLHSWQRITSKIMAKVEKSEGKSEYKLDRSSDRMRSFYYSINNCHTTIKTIAWFAKQDNPDNYNEWHKKWCQPAIEAALSCTHSDVARFLYRTYWLDFVCASLSGPRWFHYKNHRYIETEKGIDLLKTISNDFARKFECIRKDLVNQIQDSVDDSFRANGELAMKKIGKLLEKLKNKPFKDTILRESIEWFHQPHFLSSLNQNPDITGVDNGVIEIIGKKAVFRSGNPEDYISRSCPPAYKSTYTWQDPLVKETMTWMGQVFVEDDMRDHFLKFMASGLKGRNMDKIFPVFSGANGNNSKSMIVKAMECVFGSYCIKIPISLITAKPSDSGNASPQLARANGSRFAVLDEPDGEDTIKGGVVKRFTGGDTFFARLLHENGGDVVATFKLLLICNNIPLIPSADKAVKNRMRVFPFLSTWVTNPPTEVSEQYKQRKFKMNVMFEFRINILSAAFLWIIVQYYEKYATDKLEDPPSVVSATEEYWEHNDIYFQYAKDNIRQAYLASDSEVKDPDHSAKLTLNEVYADFKLWFKEGFSSIKVPEKTTVRAELTSRWGKIINNGWSGVKFADNVANISGDGGISGLNRALRI